MNSDHRPKSAQSDLFTRLIGHVLPVMRHYPRNARPYISWRNFWHHQHRRPSRGILLAYCRRHITVNHYCNLWTDNVAVMAYRVLHGLAPPYLSQLTRITDLPGRRRLRSSSTHSLLVPSFRRSTVGRRSFPVAASVLWNSLPLDNGHPVITLFDCFSSTA